MTPDRSLFIEGEFHHLQDFLIGTAGDPIPALDVGNIRINVMNGDTPTELILKGALYVPEMFTSLMSMKKLAANNIHFSSEKETLTYRGKTVTTVYSTDQAWFVDWETSYKKNTIPTAFATLPLAPKFLPKAIGMMASSELWHHRLGYVGYNNLLTTKAATVGMEKLTDVKDHKDCEPCALSKSHRILSKEHMERSKLPYYKLYIDTVGPITPKSFFGNRYLLNITEDADRVRHREASETKEALNQQVQNFIIKVENKLRTTLANVRMDGGKEVLNAEFIDWCKTKSVTIEVTLSRTPEMNDISERSNGVITTKIRTTLISALLPEQLWDEVAQAAVHIINPTATAVNNNINIM